MDNGQETKDDRRRVTSEARVGLVGCGAAGMVLAALFYFVAAQVQGALAFLLMTREAGIVIFAIFLGVSLVEIGVMPIALRRLAVRLPPKLWCVTAAGYVAFAGVYAIGYALLVEDARGIQILSALAGVRWLQLALFRTK